MTSRGTLRIQGRSDATLNRGGVRDRHRRVLPRRRDPRRGEGLPRRRHRRSRPATGGSSCSSSWTRASLSTPSSRGASAIASADELSPRHVPDAIVEAPGVPTTLNGKRMEVPVKRLLHGEPLEAVASIDAVRRRGPVALVRRRGRPSSRADAEGGYAGGCVPRSDTRTHALARSPPRSNNGTSSTGTNRRSTAEPSTPTCVSAARIGTGSVSASKAIAKRSASSLVPNAKVASTSLRRSTPRQALEDAGPQLELAQRRRRPPSRRPASRRGSACGTGSPAAGSPGRGRPRSDGSSRGRPRGSGSPRAAPRCTGAADRRTAPRPPDLREPPEVHHDDPVAHVPHDVQVVADEQVGQAVLALELMRAGSGSAPAPRRRARSSARRAR